MKTTVLLFACLVGLLLSSSAQNAPSFHGTLHLILPADAPGDNAVSLTWHSWFNNQRLNPDSILVSMSEFVQISTSARPTKGNECGVLMGLSVMTDGSCSSKLHQLKEAHPDALFAFVIDGKIVDLFIWNNNLHPNQLIVGISTDREAGLITDAVGKNHGR